MLMRVLGVGADSNTEGFGGCQDAAAARAKQGKSWPAAASLIGLHFTHQLPAAGHGSRKG